MDLNFDANSVEPSQTRDLIPPGKYLALIENTQEKPTKRGDGSYLELTFLLVDDQFGKSGRKLWARLNLRNLSEKAVEIAKRDLSAICHAVGVTQVRRSEELHNKPLVIVVQQVPDRQNGELRNEIKGYEPAGQSASVGGPPVSQGRQAPGAPQGRAPWGNPR